MGKRKLDKSIADDPVVKKLTLQEQRERARIYAINEGFIQDTKTNKNDVVDNLQNQRDKAKNYAIQNNWIKDDKNKTDNQQQLNSINEKIINHKNNLSSETKSSGKNLNNKVVARFNDVPQHLDNNTSSSNKNSINIKEGQPVIRPDNLQKRIDAPISDGKLKNSLKIDKSSITGIVENKKQGYNYSSIFLTLCIALLLIIYNNHTSQKQIYDDLNESKRLFMERYDNEKNTFRDYRVKHEIEKEELIKKFNLEKEELIKKFNLEKDAEMNDLYNDKKAYLKEIEDITKSRLCIENLLQESDTNHKEFVNLMFELYGHGSTQEINAEKEYNNIQKKSNKEKNDYNNAKIENEKADINVKKEEEDYKKAEDNLKNKEDMYNKEKKELEIAQDNYQKATSESVKKNKRTNESKERLKQTILEKERIRLQKQLLEELEEARIATEERLKFEKIAEQEKEEEERAKEEIRLAEELLKKEREELKKANDEKKRKKKIADKEKQEAKEAEEAEEKLKKENLEKGFFFQKKKDASDAFNDLKKLWEYFLSDHDNLPNNGTEHTETTFEIKCLFSSVEDARTVLRNKNDYINIKRRCKNNKVHKDDKKIHRELSKIFHPDKMKKINCPEEYGTQTQILVNTICD